MRLRAASVNDLALLEYWDTKPHVIAATSDNPDATDADFNWAEELPRSVAWREFLIAEVDDRPVGVLQIIDPLLEETHYWGECEPNLRAIDIWIGEEADLGRGYGTTMMQLALQRCFSAPEVDAVLIDPLASNTRAIQFYRRMGFVDVGPRKFDEDDCLVLRLDRERWQKLVKKSRRGSMEDRHTI